MKTSPRGFARRNVWRQFIFTFAAIVALQSAFALFGRTDQESPPQAPAVNPDVEPDEGGVLWRENALTGDTKGSKPKPTPAPTPAPAPTPRPFLVDSFFDVFIELDLPPLPTPTPTPKPKPKSVKSNMSDVGNAKLQPLFAMPRINEATGELFVEYLDLAIPGRGLDLVWGRTYRSKIGMDTAMGVNWDFSYNIRAAQSGSNITVQDGQNRIDTYFLQGDGSFSTDELFRHGTLAGNVFTLQFADKTNWIFKPLDGSPTSGKIDKIVDRNSNQIQFQYDGAGRLFLILDSLNRPFQISYDGFGRIQWVQDFAGRTLQYQHLTSVIPGQGGIGDLVLVRSQAVTGTPIGNDFPNGKVAQFTYSTQLGGARDHNLLTARDGLNTQWLQVVYTTTANTNDFLFDRVAREVVGTANETKVFTYLAKPSPNSGSTTATKTIVNDAIGNVHESLFDSKNRLIDLRQFTGRSTPGVPVTETSNRPVNPVRPSDPAFFQTTIDWNRDSLPTRITFPRGNGVEMVYQRDVDPATNPRERANLRKQRQLPVNGMPLVIGIEYANGFGTTEFAKDLARFAVCDPATPPGNDTCYWIWTSNQDVVPPPDWDWIGFDERDADARAFRYRLYVPTFATVITDGRGFSWRCVRDANGNATSVTRPDGVTTDIEHNGNGQLTAIVRPANHTGHRERDEWHYYSSGQQSGYLQSFIRDAGGLNLTTGVTHDSVGNVTQIVDPRGRDTQFFVNQLNQVVQITSRNAALSDPPIRYLTNIYRDANNRITHVDVQNKDEFGNVGTPPFFVTSFGYESLDHPTSITRTVDSGHTVTTQFFYNAIRDLREIDSPLAVNGTEPDARVQFAYDERDLPFTRTAAPGSSLATGSRYTYDLNGNLSRLETGAPSGPQHTTMLVYDGFDRLSQTTSPVGTQMQFSYNSNHQPTQGAVTGTFLDADGNPTTGLLAAATWTYDSTGFCTARVDSFFDVITQMPISDGARTTTYGYDPARNVIAVTDDNNHTRQFSYDGANRLTRITDPKGNRVDYTHDANGNLVTRTQTDKSDTASPDQVFVLTNVFDGLDRLITSTDNLGNAQSYLYDSRSNRVRYIDPRNKLTQSEYDGLNRLLRSGRDMNGNNSGFDAGIDIISGQNWDDNSRFIGATNPNSYSTQYQYDALGRCLRRTNADATLKTWSYDAWGNAIQSNDENATVCINNYDNNNRLRQRQIIPGPGVSNATTFEIYDYPGDYFWSERAINNASTARFTFDSLGRLTSERLGSQITNYTHDAVGNLLTLQSPGGRVLSYSHDTTNLCTGLSLIATSDGDSLGPIANYSYVGRRTERDTHRNGTSTSYTYDGFVGAPPSADLGWGQVSGTATLQLAPPPNANLGWSQVANVITPRLGNIVLDQRTFTYDANQNLSEREDTRSGGPQLLHDYDYDPANRNNHTHVTAPGPTLVRDTIYNYDLNGNRVAVTGFNTPDPGSYFQDPTTPAPADAQMNQYTITPRGSYTYDANGNRTNLAGLPPPPYRYPGQIPSNLNYVYDYVDRLVDLTDVQTGLRIANYQYDALGRRVQKTLDPDGKPNITTFIYSGRTVLEERAGGGAVTAAYSVNSAPPDTNGDIGRNHYASIPIPPDSCDGVNVDDGNARAIVVDFTSGGPRNGGVFPVIFDYAHGEVSRFNFFILRTMDPALNPPCSVAPIEMRRGGTNYTVAGGNGVSTLAWDFVITNTNGAAAERYDYEDLGDPHFFDGSGNPLPSSAIGNPYLFKGMRFDGESLLYLGNRDVRPPPPGYNWIYGAGWGCDPDEINTLTLMFDPKIGSSLQRESSHAVNSFKGTEGTSLLFSPGVGGFYTPIMGNWDGL